ncbi:hypothetical protein PCE1_004257 [Barthelona sp. PCE]
MKRSLISTMLLGIVLLLSAAKAIESPIIAVIAQPTDYRYPPYPEKQTYIAASYVKYIESAGARVVALDSRTPESEWKKVLNQVNGVLFPGGGIILVDDDGVPTEYQNFTAKIVEYVKKINSEGSVFPLMGICLGYENIAIAEGLPLNNVLVRNKAIPLYRTKRFIGSQMFYRVSDNIKLSIKEERNLGFHNHRNSFWLNDFYNQSISSISDEYIVTTVSKLEDREFVNTFEHISYPIFASMFHPEKPMFEHKVSTIPYDRYIVKFSQHIVDEFIDIARRSSHTFETEKAEFDALIYNDVVTDTRSDAHKAFTQIYYYD